jgi:hypothetical protein
MSFEKLKFSKASSNRPALMLLTHKETLFLHISIVGAHT